MIITILSGTVCIFAGVICFFPYFSKIPLLRPMATFIIFQGLCMFLSYVMKELSPESLLPTYINGIGSIIIVLYFTFVMFMTYKKSKNKHKGE